MKKANKATAMDWRESERDRIQRDDDISRQSMALFYAANKRDGPNFPCAHTLDHLGFPEAARLVRQAYSLLADAETSFNNEKSSL